MNTKELLELAAAAVGYEIDQDPPSEDGLWLLGDAPAWWNPIDDDGDAFRLAVKMRFRIECTDEGQVYIWLGEQLVWNQFALHTDNDQERAAATRIAIVRATAEIVQSRIGQNQPTDPFIYASSLIKIRKHMEDLQCPT